MCGICGIYPLTSNSPSPNRIQEMNQCQRHRGPDDGSKYITDDIGLGHRRLSIIDPESGDQPITNEEGDIITIFNGEIYNYQSLREDLLTAGHQFTSNTDTEVIVHAFEEYGSPEFIQKLDGMFAFAIWDERSDELLLARDRMGIKPLYLGVSEDELVFGSELMSILQSKFEHGGLDWDALSQFLVFGQIPAPQSAFNNIEKVQPGEYVRIFDNRIKRESYYYPSISSFSGGYEQAKQRLRSLVTRSVKKRLMSDVPLGAFLSGGIDSSIIVGIMSELSNDPIKTFTIGFEEEQYDERGAARTVADFHETDHTEFTVTADYVRDIVPDVLSVLGEPFADPSLIPTYVVAKNTSRDVTVALSGDGADELFSGYTRYRGEYASKYLRYLPKPVVDHGIGPVMSMLPAHRESHLGMIGRYANRFISANHSDISRRHLHWIRPDAEVMNDCIDQRSPVDLAENQLKIEHNRIGRNAPEITDLQAIQAVDTTFGLPNQMLTKVDTASMANSLEVRVPFLDTDVVEFALSLPQNYTITPTKQKRILIESFDDVLPPEIQSRSKQGFDMPIGTWFRTDLSDEITDAISQLKDTQIDTDTLESLLTTHNNRNQDHSRALWHVYVLADWFSRMKNKDII